MKTTGVGCEPKFGLLVFLGHPNPEQQFATFEEEKTIQRGKLRKFGQNNKLSETTMCKHVVWNDNLQKVIRNNNDMARQFGNFAKKKRTVKEKEENIARRKISFW